MDAEGLKSAVFSRRSALKTGAATAFLISQATLLEQLASPVARADPAPMMFPDIQFNLGNFIRPAFVVNDGAGNVTLQLPPVYTMFLPVQLTRTPTPHDQAILNRALNTIENSYPASPAGVLIFSVSYGLPYFDRLPPALVAANIPTTLADPSRSALVEAVPSPTDVVDGVVGGPNALIPGVTKDRFNVDVMIESNDMLFELRSDSLTNLAAVALWLQGSNNLNGDFVPSPDIQRAAQLPDAAHPVHADRPAARDGRQRRLRVRRADQPRLLDGHGLRRPADQRVRPGRRSSRSSATPRPS